MGEKEKNKEKVDYVNTAKTLSMYEMYMAGEYLSDLASMYKMEENQVYSLLKSYKNKHAKASERDADTGDIVLFKLKGCKFKGETIKRYKNSILVSFDETKFRGNDDDKLEVLLLGEKYVVSDRDYRITKAVENKE